MTTLIVKLLLTPILIALVSLAGRRWGPAASGLLVGLPLTSGPVSVFLALEQGTTFAALAATGTLVGLAGVSVFCLAYCLTARGRSWGRSTLVALGAFVPTMALLGVWTYTLPVAFAMAFAFLLGTYLLIPNLKETLNKSKPPKWDLPVRMLIATGLVLSLTEAASLLGPELSGLLSPLPVFSTILAVFAHHTHGAASGIRVLKGQIIGLFAFATFFLIVGSLLTQLEILLTYTIATAAALVISAFAHLYVRREGSRRSLPVGK